MSLAPSAAACLQPSDIRWASRWDTYLKMTDDQIHWFSIVNSVMIVLFLSGMVAMIMVSGATRSLLTTTLLCAAHHAPALGCRPHNTGAAIDQPCCVQHTMQQHLAAARTKTDRRCCARTRHPATPSTVSNEPPGLTSPRVVVFPPFVVAQVRTLYRDISKYNQLDTQEDAAEETGWKLVRALGLGSRGAAAQGA